jgi:nicotinamidase-related amidase
MKKITCFLVLLLIFSQTIFSQQKIRIKNDSLPSALLIIDVQDFYFPGGKLPLSNPEKASRKASELLKLYRSQKLPVIHVQHKGGGKIHENVAPLAGEKVITKEEANSFSGTDLLDYLKFLEVKRLMICGMQTHMCVEAAVRAAYDYGFMCFIVQDACATRELKWNDQTISAADVHASTLASLNRYYGSVINVADLE